MVKAADGRPIVLFNANLDDIKSTEDVMSVRGRSERMAFAASFKPIFEYRTLYPSPSVYYPIVGAVCKPGPREPYIAFERQEEPVATQADAVPWAGRGDDEESCEVDDESCDDDAFFVNAAGVKLRERHVARATYDALPTDAEVLAVLRESGAKWRSG